MHRAWHPDLDSAIVGTPPTLPIVLDLHGPEAEHLARARRARPDEPIALHDGAGRIATGLIQRVWSAGKREGPAVSVRVDQLRELPTGPALHVRTAVPKGGRIDEMIEQLSQVGASSWSPLRCARSVVDPRPTKLERLERLAIESMKQCGRAWCLRVADHTVGFAEALQPRAHASANDRCDDSEPPPAGRGQGVGSGDPIRAVARAPALADASEHPSSIILADASGLPAIDWLIAQHQPRGVASPHRTTCLLIGPEGGWTPDELAAARAAGAEILSFGPHAMRIETAAVAASAVINAAFA